MEERVGFKKWKVDKTVLRQIGLYEAEAGDGTEEKKKGSYTSNEAFCSFLIG